MFESSACCLWDAILPVGLALAAIAFIYGNGTAIRQRIFVLFYLLKCRGINSDLEATRAAAFAELKDAKSVDANLRNKGQIRVLEVGVGPGSNFKFYPKNARLIALDTNPYFRGKLEKNAAEFPNVTLERVVVGAGEDMAEVKDGSVDVVITTYVLCSVNDVKQVLKEIKRVLAPGGKYFFLERGQGAHHHAHSHHGGWNWHSIIQPIWSILFGHHNIIDVAKMISDAGFSETNFKSNIAPPHSDFTHDVGGNAKK